MIKTYYALSAEAHHRDSHAVVAGIHVEFDLRQQPREVVYVAPGFLYGDDFVVLREFFERVDGNIYVGSAGNVIQNNRQRGASAIVVKCFISPA